jgi:hypothetical protein
MACLRNLAIGALCPAGPVNLAASLRHHGRDPARPLATRGSSPDEPDVARERRRSDRRYDDRDDNEAIQLGENSLLRFGMQQKADVLAEVVGGSSTPACRPVMRSGPTTQPPSQAAIDRAAWESPADV